MNLFLDKSEQFATFEQSKELLALGVKHSNPFYYVHKEGNVISYCNWGVSFDTCTIAFTLADIMALLPKTILYEDYVYELNFSICSSGYYVSYINGDVEMYGPYTTPNMCLTHVAAQLLINVLKDSDIQVIEGQDKPKLTPPALDSLIMQLLPHQSILDIVVNLGGVLTLSKNYFGVSVIWAVVFTEQHNESIITWNDYVAKIKEAIGVKSYCEWVRNSKNEMVGIIALYDRNGEEMKTKHFDRWWGLLEHIKNTDLSHQLGK